MFILSLIEYFQFAPNGRNYQFFVRTIVRNSICRTNELPYAQRRQPKSDEIGCACSRTEPTANCLRRRINVFYSAYCDVWMEIRVGRRGAGRWLRPPNESPAAESNRIASPIVFFEMHLGRESVPYCLIEWWWDASPYVQRHIICILVLYYILYIVIVFIYLGKCSMYNYNTITPAASPVPSLVSKSNKNMWPFYQPIGN